MQVQAFHSVAASTTLNNHSVISRGVSLKSMTADNVEVAIASVTEVMPTENILEQMRAKMKSFDFDVFLVPSDDAHLSEYTAEAFRRRAFVSKFTGSAGTAVILANDIVLPEPESDSDEEGDPADTPANQKKALLWTDSRYYNEAGMQLDADYWTLMKQGLKGVPTLTSFLKKLAKAKKCSSSDTAFRVGIDGFVHSASFCKELQEELEPENGMICTLDEVGQTTNIVDEIWGDARPSLPSSPFRIHPLKYAGISVKDKITKIRKEMKKCESTMSVFSTLDDVAYLLNVRASDVDCCPVGKL